MAIIPSLRAPADMRRVSICLSHWIRFNWKTLNTCGLLSWLNWQIVILVQCQRRWLAAQLDFSKQFWLAIRLLTGENGWHGALVCSFKWTKCIRSAENTDHRIWGVVKAFSAPLPISRNAAKTNIAWLGSFAVEKNKSSTLWHFFHTLNTLAC